MVENQREDDRRPRRRGTPWLSRRRPVTDPVARLYCLPHSGGAAGEYLRWADQLPQLEVWGVNLPGRGSRLDEPPMESMTELAAGLVDAVTFTGRFGLFGHSFGALLAYHVAQRLREVGRAQPSQLILSSYPPPHLPRQLRVLSDLPDQEFLRQLDEAYGGVPAELQADPELMELVVPAYRADLRILERYTDPQLPPLSCPMLVIGGEQDRFDADELGQWARHTTGECLVRMLPGGHFYFRPDNEPLRALLYEQLGVSAPAA